MNRFLYRNSDDVAVYLLFIILKFEEINFKISSLAQKMKCGHIHDAWRTDVFLQLHESHNSFHFNEKLYRVAITCENEIWNPNLGVDFKQ